MTWTTRIPRKTLPQLDKIKWIPTSFCVRSPLQQLNKTTQIENLFHFRNIVGLVSMISSLLSTILSSIFRTIERHRILQNWITATDKTITTKQRKTTKTKEARRPGNKDKRKMWKTYMSMCNGQRNEAKADFDISTAGILILKWRHKHSHICNVLKEAKRRKC